MKRLYDSSGFSFEWHKDGILALTTSQTSPFFIPSNAQNGTYVLKVNIPNANTVSSNPIHVNLGISESFTVGVSGVICETGGNITLSVNNTNSDYTYSWFKSGNTVALGTNSTLNVTTIGDYYYSVTYEGCTATSEVIALSMNDGSTLTLNIPEELIVYQGSTHEVIASGAESYTWYLNNSIIGENDNLIVSHAGIYNLVGRIGTCTFEKTFSVSLIENTSVIIPNLITLNGDGKNDFWSIPSEYVNKEDVIIVLYASNGSLVYKTNNYQNNWPNESFSFSLKESVLYYIITKNEEVLKKGSLTIIK